jgi:general secretion pathway protein D
MRWLSAGFVLLLGGVCLAANTPPTPAPSQCTNASGASACEVSKKDLKTARKAFERGLKLETSELPSGQNLQNLNQAFYEFEAASRLVPENLDYLSAQEVARQRLAGMHLELGNTDLFGGHKVEALAEFQAALTLDPQNEFAQQRISDALGPVPTHTTGAPQLVASSDALVAKPIDGRHDFHYRGDSRGLITAVAASYGLTVIFDDSFVSHHVLFDIENVDFSTAIQSVSIVTKSFSVALGETELYTSAETAENHRLFDRMGMRSFYIPGSGARQDLQDLMNSLRAVFDFKVVSLEASSSTITVRGPQAALAAAAQFMGQWNSPDPEVMIDVKVFQVNHSYMRDVGLHIPDNFNLFNIPAAALAGLAGVNLQQLLAQIAAGTANSSALTAILAQLQGQNGPFAQPVATFGGGLTFFGLSLDQLSAALTMNESSLRQLNHVQLRASQGKDATFKLGERYPIITASFGSGLPGGAVGSAISQALGGQSLSVPVPSISYEDLGLTVKAKPRIHNNSDVALELDIELRSLGAATTNGPIILNREYKGGILLKPGEEAVLAGMVTESDEKSLSGLPAFSNIPGFGLLTSQQTRQKEDDELLILITPYVVRSVERNEASEIWIK